MSTTKPTQNDLRDYQQQLQVLADRLLGKVADLTAEATRPTGIESMDTEMAKEPMATSTEGDEEVARGILRSEEQLLTEVCKALARFDAGTFGYCERCRQPIGRQRLRAIPYAHNCSRCANVENIRPNEEAS